MKLLSLDYGRRRIGIATTDDTGTLVRGLTTIDQKISKDPIADIINIINSENPSSLIVGLPLDVDNNETEMSKEVRSFVAKLQNQLTIPAFFIDESYSSIQAAEILFCRKKKYRRTKINVDRIAACLVLETYIKNPASAYK